MTMIPSDPEFNRLLARAFDRAWERYYRSGRATATPEVARPKLAKIIVKMAREGERDEEALTAAGVTHLILLNSLLPDDWRGPG
jgi:hypothetical protein